MEIKLKDFFELGKIVSFVNFHGSFQKCKNSGKIAYIFDEPFLQNISVDKYLKKKIKNFSKEKFEQACRMALLDVSILTQNISKLSYTETKKLRFVEGLLFHSEVFLFVNFEKGFLFKNRSYYQKLFLKLTKYGKGVILITDDLNFLMGIVSSFYYFDDKGYRLVTDFYDDQIYKMIETPFLISYVKYLEHRGLKIEHYLESKEVLKAIYRSVTSGDHL
jgi:translation initiation factor RLI1